MKPVSLFSHASSASRAAFYYARYILIFVSLVASTEAYAFGQDKTDIRFISFRGAEIYTETSDSGTVTVFLKKYYDCGMESDAETEMVSIFEMGTMTVNPPIILKRVSNATIENRNLNTPADPKRGCLSLVVYSAKVPLGTGRAEYNITWSYAFGNTRFTNIDHSKTEGVSLVLRVSKGEKMIANTMPALSSLPVFIMAPNGNVSNAISFEDKDRDGVRFSVSTPFSTESIKTNTPVFSNGIMTEAKEGNITTGRWPLKEVVYANTFSSKNPINGKVFSIDANSGMLNSQPNSEVGKYLACITISELREDKIISEHQCVFVIDVK